MNVVDVTDVYASGVDYGITVTGADYVTVTDSTVSDAMTGLSIADSSTGLEATMNTIDADTGVVATDISSDSVAVEYNDLEMTETAVAQEGDHHVDARHNWFGERGPSDISGDVVHQPFLTDTPSEADHEPPTEIALDLELQAATVGVPGTTDQTVGDLEGSTYGYDAADDTWEDLRMNDELDSLSAMVVVADEGGEIVLDFEHEDDTIVPASEELHQGWNLVSPTAYTSDEGGFGSSQARTPFRRSSDTLTAISAMTSPTSTTSTTSLTMSTRSADTGSTSKAPTTPTSTASISTPTRRPLSGPRTDGDR